MSEKESLNNKEESIKNYDLKSSAVEDLLSAFKEEEEVNKNSVHKKYIPKENNEQEFNPYKIDKLAKIPTWIKVFFVKVWVAGAICYFCLWGLGAQVYDILDRLILTAVITGIVVDFMLNPAFLYFESDKKEYHKYMLIPVPAKQLWSLPINIIVSIIEILIIFWIYSSINIMYNKINNKPDDYIFLGVEPILYGLLFLIIDMAIISIKNLLVKVIKKNKN